MKYVGLQTQIWRNNIKSLILLILFPALIIVLVWLFLFFINENAELETDFGNEDFIQLIPWITIGVLVWFIVAYFSHSALIKRATGSKPMERTENKRVYNLVENLCIGSGMQMPKVNLIDDDSLNAFASGVDSRSYTISLSRGIIDTLNDEELEGVIAHELTHIKNRDVRLLIVSIIFVGIFAFLTELLLRSIRFSGRGKKEGKIIIIALLLVAVGYLLSSIFRFAISRSREYMADAGASGMTKKPWALASALAKVAKDSRIEAVEQKDVAQLFFDNPQEKSRVSNSIMSIFATHPPIEMRIELLKGF